MFDSLYLKVVSNDFNDTFSTEVVILDSFIEGKNY